MSKSKAEKLREKIVHTLVQLYIRTGMSSPNQNQMRLIFNDTEELLKACREAICEVCLEGSDMPECPLNKGECKFEQLFEAETQTAKC